MPPNDAPQPPPVPELEARVRALEEENRRLRAEVDAQVPAQVLQTVLDHMPAMIGYWDKDLRNRFGNRAYSSWFGIEPNQMTGAHIRDVLGPERYQLNLPYIEGALRGEPQEFERAIPAPDGSRVRHSLAEYLPDIVDGEVRGFFVQVSDVTAVKEAQAALALAKDAAEAGSRAKSAFLATMSHELRTPMNGILGMAQLLTMGGLSAEEQRQYAAAIFSSGNVLLSLLNDILDLSKVEAGKLELTLAPCDPGQLISETIAAFADEARLKSLELTGDWTGRSGQVYRTDPKRLRQVLVNLVHNALKFTAAGFVRVSGRELESSGGAAMLELAVEDSGIGITDAQRSQLFLPFSQLDSSSTRKYGGTGLGLSIVLQLAKLLGGDAGVERASGPGARFWVRVRAELLSDAPPSARTPPSRAPSGAEDLALDPAWWVLVVEDNATNRLVNQALLKRLGVRSSCLEDGEAAVAALTRGLRPSLVLMDVQMPVMDGLEATRRIRAWERETGAPHTPIVALTASAFDSDRAAAVAAGMDDFLSKPIAKGELAAKLARWARS